MRAREHTSRERGRGTSASPLSREHEAGLDPGPLDGTSRHRTDKVLLSRFHTQRRRLCLDLCLPARSSAARLRPVHALRVGGGGLSSPGCGPGASATLAREDAPASRPGQLPGRVLLPQSLGRPGDVPPAPPSAACHKTRRSAQWGGPSARLLYLTELMLESPWHGAGGQGPHHVIRGWEHSVPPLDLWERRRAGGSIHHQWPVT